MLHIIVSNVNYLQQVLSFNIAELYLGIVMIHLKDLNMDIMFDKYFYTCINGICHCFNLLFGDT